MMKRKGFTLVEIMIVVAIIGLLAAIAIPNFVRARAVAQQNACIANLKQIEGAQQVALLDGMGGGVIGNLTWDLLTNPATGYLKKKVTCPANPSGSDYVVNTDPPTCPNVGTYATHTLTPAAAAPAGG